MSVRKYYAIVKFFQKVCIFYLINVQEIPNYFLLRMRMLLLFTSYSRHVGMFTSWAQSMAPTVITSLHSLKGLNSE
jgi:hypothetical protein